MLGEGPMLEGHWYNPKTGDSFTVRDTFFEDDNIIVMTTDGRRMDYNMISQYVKTDKPMPKQKPKQEIPQSILNQVLPVQKPTSAPIQPPSSPDNDYNDLLSPEDKALLNEVVAVNPLEQVIAQPMAQPTQKVEPVKVEDEDEMLIRRILKRATDPSVDCKITWKNFPSKQFDMLEMMAVDSEKIVDYYLSKIDLEAVREIVKRGIFDYIDKMMTAQEVKLVIPEENPVNQGYTMNSREKEIATPVEKTQVAKSKRTSTKTTANSTTKKTARKK